MIKLWCFGIWDELLKFFLSQSWIDQREPKTMNDWIDELLFCGFGCLSSYKKNKALGFRTRVEKYQNAFFLSDSSKKIWESMCFSLLCFPNSTGVKRLKYSRRALISRLGPPTPLHLQVYAWVCLVLSGVADFASFPTISELLLKVIS